MREIKFRAWDDGLKEYMSIDRILEWLTFNGEAGGTSGFIDSKTREPIEYRFEIEQSTGLHDKTKWEDATHEQRQGYTKETWKGVEIYEGDIVKIIHMTHEFCGMIGRVNYLSASFWITGSLGGTDHWIGEWVEVIGDIHTTPELLEQDNVDTRTKK